MDYDEQSSIITLIISRVDYDEQSSMITLIISRVVSEWITKNHQSLIISRVENWRMTRLLNLLDEADVPEGSSSKTEIEERRPHDKLLQAAEYGAARCLYFQRISYSIQI